MTQTQLELQGSLCPCNSGDIYDTCCRQWHEQGSAPTALQLMRARFTAYAVGNTDFVWNTWDANTRPLRRELELDGESPLVWKRLIIENVDRGGPFDSEGTVVFTAIGRGADGRVVLREKSYFERQQGVWVYVDGEVADA